MTEDLHADIMQELCRKQGVGYTGMAKLLGVDRSTVGHIYLRRGCVGLKLARLVEQKLGVPVSTWKRLATRRGARGATEYVQQWRKLAYVMRMLDKASDGIDEFRDSDYEAEALSAEAAISEVRIQVQTAMDRLSRKVARHRCEIDATALEEG